ncbi:exosortase family protein XrtG [Leuconostoc lactis]|nr:exosortase family protein XrtG [Leuconostoc lactis]
MLKYMLLFVGFVFWLYCLTVLKRAKNGAFYFLVGSTGLFIGLLLMSKPYGIWLFATAMTWAVGLVGQITGFFTTFYLAHVIQVVNHHHLSLFMIDYECSGLIESAAFLGLIAFYPIYSRQHRVILAVLGLIWLFVANIVRLSLVAIMIHFFGDRVFYLAHAILGRLLFYSLAIILYYLVFTKGQLVNRLFKKLG